MQGLSVKTFYYRLKVIRKEMLSETDQHDIVPLMQCKTEMPSDMSTIMSDEKIHITGNGIQIAMPANVSSELITAILRERGIDGLAGIVQQNFKLDVCSGAVFLFCGRRYDRIKALLWEGDIFLLLYKRLDNGRFQWPRNKTEAEQITAEQYTWLMQGLSIEQPKAIKKSKRKPDIM